MHSGMHMHVASATKQTTWQTLVLHHYNSELLLLIKRTINSAFDQKEHKTREPKEKILISNYLAKLEI